jgi:hypothetical protein
MVYFCIVNQTKPMVRNLKTAAVILAVLFTATATVSAQEKKQVEKKVITVITVDDNGVKTDTTITTYDTLNFEGDRIIINAEDEDVMHGAGKGNKMIFIEKEACGPDGPEQMMQMKHMKNMDWTPEAKEGISYHITVDGVTVNIRAPKEKAKEADLILTEVKKVLLKK